MASWLQSKLSAAQEYLEAVDQKVASTRAGHDSEALVSPLEDGNSKPSSLTDLGRSGSAGFTLAPGAPFPFSPDSRQVSATADFSQSPTSSRALARAQPTASAATAAAAVAAAPSRLSAPSHQLKEFPTSLDTSNPTGQQSSKHKAATAATAAPSVDALDTKADDLHHAGPLSISSGDHKTASSNRVSAWHHDRNDSGSEAAGRPSHQPVQKATNTSSSNSCQPALYSIQTGIKSDKTSRGPTSSPPIPTSIPQQLSPLSPSADTFPTPSLASAAASQITSKLATPSVPQLGPVKPKSSISSATGILGELADGLLGGAGGGGSSAGVKVSAASSREQQLSRVNEQQRKRLEAARAEAHQLEELLHVSEEKVAVQKTTMQQLGSELTAVQESKSLVESGLHFQLSSLKALNAELSCRCSALEQQGLRAEANAAALQETNQELLDGRKDVEGGMLEALKAELTGTEQRLEAELKAHQATKVSAVSRERELEHFLSDTSNALADKQRSREESLMEINALRDQVALLESAKKDLASQVERLGGDHTNPPGSGVTASLQYNSSKASLQLADLVTLRAEAAHQHRALTQSEAARKAADKKLHDLEEEVEGLRMEVDKFSARKDTSQLEAQLREASDMICLKQSQIEKLSSDKAAATLTLERDLITAREEIARLRHVNAGYTVHASSSSSHDVIPIDALGAPYQRLAGSSNRVGKAIKAAGSFLDSSASAVSFFLSQYPLARLIIFGYLLLVHFYIYILIARMQAMSVHLDAMVTGSAAVV